MTQHIFIAGISYCGSTLFSLCMGSLPGCVAVDESNWLVPHPGSALPGFRFSDSDYKPVCRHCDGECRFFSKRFREELQEDPSNWAVRIGERFSGLSVVTAEKESHYLDSIYSDSAYDMVVLFKHPLSQWRSFEKRPWRNDSEESVVARWCNEYASHLGRETRGKKVFVEFDRFLSNPERVIKRLARSLNLEYSPDFLEYWKRDHHYVGGNFSLKEKLDKAPQTLPIQKPDTVKHGRMKGEGVKEFTEQFPNAMRLYKELLKHHV